MHIINFISGRDLGGPKQSFLHYTEVLQRHGHSVHSLIRRGAPLRALLEPISMDIGEIAYPRSNAPFVRKLAARRLARAMLPQKPDLILVHKQLDIKLVRAGIGPDIPIIGVIHGYNARHIEDADALIAVSESVKDFLERAGYTHPIHVIPNMVRMPAEEPSLQPIAKPPVIGTMGMFRRKKGMDVLIRALALLHDEGLAFEGIIAGKGINAPRLKALKHRLGLDRVLTIRPWLTNNERDPFLDHLDIFCLPSRSESFGMVVTEAMARKKRIVATRCGGPEEILEDGITGLLVENDNPAALAVGIRRALDARQSDTMAEAAYHAAKARFSLEAVSDALDTLISPFNTSQAKN